MSKKKNTLLGIDLETIINESIASLFESKYDGMEEDALRELQKQRDAEEAQKNLKSRFSSKDKKDQAADEAEEPGTKEVQVKPEKIPEIDAKAIRNKIDNIRAGKSLKDPETKSAFKAYFQKLNGPERIALFAFLSGLEKVLGKASKDVKTPHSDPFNVDMETNDDVSAKKVYSQSKGSKSISKSKESESPIIVGERADIRAIKAKLWRK